MNCPATTTESSTSASCATPSGPGAPRRSERTRQDGGVFSSPAAAAARLAQVRYLTDDATATTVYLAAALEKPLLVEGPAGVGKTQLAKAVAAATGAELIR